MTTRTCKNAGRLLVLFSVVLLVQLATGGPMLEYDDAMYAGVAQSGDILGWLVQRYAVWSSRSLIDLVTILVVTHETLWMVLNALVITGMCLAISVLASRDGLVCFNKAALALACFWLIPANMMYWSVWWLTGSINYLWPATAALIYWAVVKYELSVTRTSLWVLAAGLVMALFSSFSEQIMVVNFLVHGYLMCVRKGGYFRNRAAVAGLLVNAVGFAFFILCEGNASRALFSAQTYFPEFLDMGVLEKAYFGISLGLYQFFYMGSWVSIIFCFVIALRFDAPYAKYIAMAGLLFIMMTSGYMLGYTGSGFSELTDNIDFIGGVYQIDYHDAFTHEFYRAMAWGVAFSVALAVALLGNLASFRHLPLRQALAQVHINRALLFVLSFLPSCMLGFSPTMYESQERVLFASSAILLLLIVTVAGRGRYSWHFLAATTVVAFFTYAG
ncbi:DUF6056 family protein [Vreelandella sp. EE22]